MVPDDIAIHALSVAPEGFDARFSALERTYVYRICDDARPVDPRMRGFVLALDDRLDLDAMNAAAAMTIGLHDFGSFATPNPGGTTIREVKRAYWSRIPVSPWYRERPAVPGPPAGTPSPRPNPDWCASQSWPTPSLAIWCVPWSTPASRWDRAGRT